jgi:hypothetical protein
MSGIVIRVVDSSINIEPNIEESTNKKPDIYLKYLIRTTFISCLRSKNKYINYLTFILLSK